MNLLLTLPENIQNPVETSRGAKFTKGKEGNGEREIKKKKRKGKRKKRDSSLKKGWRWNFAEKGDRNESAVDFFAIDPSRSRAEFKSRRNGPLLLERFPSRRILILRMVRFSSPIIPSARIQIFGRFPRLSVNFYYSTFLYFNYYENSLF